MFNPSPTHYTNDHRLNASNLKIRTNTLSNSSSSSAIHRSVITTRNYAAGEVIIENTPIAFVLHPKYQHQYCDYCFRNSKEVAEYLSKEKHREIEAKKLSRCSACKVVSYCSKDCQLSAFRSYHRFECSVFKDEVKKKQLFSLDENSLFDVLLLGRVMRRRLQQDTTSSDNQIIIDGLAVNSNVDVDNLESHYQSWMMKVKEEAEKQQTQIVNGKTTLVPLSTETEELKQKLLENTQLSSLCQSLLLPSNSKVSIDDLNHLLTAFHSNNFSITNQLVGYKLLELCCKFSNIFVSHCLFFYLVFVPLFGSVR